MVMACQRGRDDLVAQKSELDYRMRQPDQEVGVPHKALALSGLPGLQTTTTMLSRAAVASRFLHTAQKSDLFVKGLATVSSRTILETVPLPLPLSADAYRLATFGREIKGVKPGELTQGQLQEVEELLYKVRLSGPYLHVLWIECSYNLLIARYPLIS